MPTCPHPQPIIHSTPYSMAPTQQPARAPPISLPTKVRRTLVGHKGPIYTVRFNGKALIIPRALVHPLLLPLSPQEFKRLRRDFQGRGDNVKCFFLWQNYSVLILRRSHDIHFLLSLTPRFPRSPNPNFGRIAKGTYCMTGGQDKTLKLWNPFRSSADTNKPGKGESST